MFIYIDESGDMEANKGTKYFIIAAIFCNAKDSTEINTIIKMHNRNLWVNGWPKNIEIKANHLYAYEHYITDKKTLNVNPKYCLQNIYREINNLDMKIASLIHDTSNQGIIFRYLHKERIYNYLSKRLYNACFGYLKNPMDIIIDQRNIALVRKQKNVNLSKHRLNLDYIGYIRNELSFLFGRRRKEPPIIDIRFEDSRKVKGLQVADYIAWAIRKKYEGRPYWFNLLNNIEKIEKRDNFK